MTQIFAHFKLAGHCLSVKNNKVTHVRVGEWDLETEIDCDEVNSDYAEEQYCAPAPIDIEVTKAHLHPGYEKKE